MFNYEVMCMICGKNKVYEVFFKEKLSEDDIKAKKSGAVCGNCAPNYKTALDAKTKVLVSSSGPFFKLKADK
jgi:hypothetical protein